MSAVPSGFVDLFAASSRLSTQVDVIGVVTDIMPPSRSKGTDWICTFSIADSTFGGDYDQGLKIRFFKPTESELPKIQGTGDVIVLRSMKITQWSGTTMAISNRHSTWTIFPASSIPERAPSNNIQLKHIKEARATIPSPEIMLYATCLCNARDRSSFNEPISKPQTLPQAMSANTSPSAASSITPAPHSRRDKFSLIKDVVIDVFYDVVGQVVKIFPSNGCVELYITDYTSNNLLYNYEWGQDDSEAISRDGDDYGYVPRASSRRQWPGPFGKMTMTVTLWPPHSYFANGNVKELDFVHLRNMRVKNNKDVKMEGSLHSDRLWPDRVDVMILKDNREDDRVKDVLRRKLEYTKRFKSQSQAFVEEVRGQKRKATGDDKPLSKAQAKKRRKQEMEKLAEAKRQEALNIKKPHGKENTTIDSKRNEGHDGRHQTPDTSPPPARPPKLELNKNVKSSHSAIPPRPLSSILSLSTHALTTPNGTPYTLPFQNIKSRTTARVIDFFPSNLADFAIRSRKPSEFDVLSDQEDSGSGSSRRNSENEDAEKDDQQWEWRFALLLEEAGTPVPKGLAKSTMTVYIANDDAEFLLKLDAENLHTNPQALAALREKLFLLWGDLEEQKTAEALEQNQTRKAMGQIEWNGQGKTECGEAPRRKAFQCCLKEYGVRSRRRRNLEEGGDESGEEDLGWERRWRMFGTTII